MNERPIASPEVPAQDRRGRVAHERVAALRIGRKDHVGRRRGQVAVAVLRFAQLALEPVGLGHVADGAIHADEVAVTVEGGHGRELGRQRAAVAAEEVDPPADLLRTGS